MKREKSSTCKFELAGLEPSCHHQNGTSVTCCHHSSKRHVKGGEMWKGESVLKWKKKKKTNSKDRIKSQILRNPSLVSAAPPKCSLLNPQGARNLSSSHFFSGPAHSRGAGWAALALLLKSWDLNIHPFIFGKTGDTNHCFPANCRELERQNTAIFANYKYLETSVQTVLIHWL